MSEEKRQSIRDAYTKYKENPELNGDKLIACLESYRQSWHGERKTQERLWRQTAAFYGGDHYVRDPGSSSAPTYRVKLRENHVNNSLNRMLSIFVQNLPVPRVFPNTINYEDVQNAENSEAYVKYFHRKSKMEQKYIKAIKYAAIFGNGFLFRQYDPDKGGKVVLDTTESESGEKELHEYRGEIAVMVDDPFRINVRPGIDEMDDMYDFMRSIPTSRDALESKYGPIEAEPANAYNAYTGSVRQDDERIMQHHYYHKPTPWFEEGLYVCWAGKKLLKVRPAAECETELPLIHLPFDKSPMRFWGTSSIEQVMDLQEQLNRAASMIVEARNLMARPRVLASNEAKIPAQALSDRPGEIIRYALAGGKPSFETPNFNFTELAAHKADVRNALQQVIGITSASRGEIPAATRTALALQLVLEQDRSQYLPFIKCYHQSILDINMGVLQTAAEFFDSEDPRVIKIEGDQDSRTFHGGMVPSPLDMYLEDTNPLGWTAAGRTESVMELVKAGVIQDRHQVLEMLKLNSPDPAFEFVNINRQAQLKENEMLKKGQMLQIGPEDNDAVHLDEITKTMASFSFRYLPRAVQDAFKAHAEAHKARVSQMAPASQGKAATSGGIDPKSALSMLQAPQPGQNLEALLAE